MELIVSVTITVVLMLGLSVFFSSTFHGLTKTQEETQVSQQQFTSGEILREKLRHIDRILDGGTNGNDFILFRNNEEGVQPFSYIAKNGNEIVIKDFFLFSAIKGAEYIDPGAGEIRPAIVGSPASFTGLKNASSFVALGGDYYVVFPLENKIQKCVGGACADWVTTDLDMPTDIATDNSALYVTDSGSDRIVQVALDGTVAPIASGFNFPTGIAYGTTGGNPSLFVADTLNHLVKKIDIATKTVSTIAGDGDVADCDGGTALYCKLDLPTGLHFENNELWIADSGAGKIFKMKDPGVLMSYDFNFKLKSNTIVSKIIFTFPSHSTDLDALTESANTLHWGNYSFAGDTMTLGFGTTLAQDSQLTYCPPAQAPLCFLETVEVGSPEVNLFKADGEAIKVGNDDFTIDYFDTPATISVHLDPNNTQNSYPAGTAIRLNKTFPPDPFAWDLNFAPNAAKLPGLFNNIKIDIYDETDTIVQTEYFILRQGDAILGTPEDMMELVKDGLNFPTGVDDEYVSNTLSRQIIQYAVDSEVGAFGYFDPVPLTQFDYATGGDFNIFSFSFTQMNGGKILKAEIQIDFDKDGGMDPSNRDKIYEISAPLP